MSKHTTTIRSFVILFLLFVFCPVGIFFCIFRFYEGFQAGLAALPEDTILFEPRIDYFQRLRVQLVEAMPAFAPLMHEMCPPKQTQMFRDGGA